VDPVTNNCNACGQVCDQDYINVIGYQEIDNAIKAARVQIGKYQSKVICELRLGYGGCSSLELKERDQLLSLICVLERYQSAVDRKTKPCLCPEQVQKVIESVKKLANFDVCSSETYDNHSVDDSYLQEYIDLKLGPVAYKPWERAMRLTMPSFDVSATLQKCTKFTYDLKVEMGERFKPGFLYEIDVAREKSCNIEFQTEVEIEKCSIEYQAIVEKVPSCKITFETYVELRKCDISYDTIVEFEKCNISIDYNEEAQDFIIKTSHGEEYLLSELEDIDKVLNNIQ